MTICRRRLGEVKLAGGGAALFALASLMTTAVASADDVALIMGGTGNPDPTPAYLAAVDSNYIQILYPGYTAVPQFTPEQGFPLTPNLGNLTFDQSVAQGVSDLDDGIRQQVGAGNDVVVFGYSQSATVATNELTALASDGNPYPDQLSFVLVGDPNNPDGGLFERFAGLYIPIFDETFNGATPPDTPYPTDIFTVQYDGYADFPQYPLNLVADANALVGAYEQHFAPVFDQDINGTIPDGTYPTLPGPDIAVQLPTSPDYYADGGQTYYYEILTQNLPLLDPLRDVPVVGNPLADLVQPDLRVIVDLGYGDGYANVPTPAGLFPELDLSTVFTELELGAQQGVTAALVDIGALPSSDLPDLYPYLPSVEPPGEIADPSTAASTLASLLMPLHQELLDLFSTSGLAGLNPAALLSSVDLPSILADLNTLGAALDPSWLF